MCPCPLSMARPPTKGNLFEPRRSLRNGHWMTLFSWGNPRYFPRLPRPVRRYFDVDHDARVAADCHWQPRPWEHPTILALEEPRNRLYQWNFVKDLKRRMRRKNRFWPGRFDMSKLSRIRTVREFDEAYTAPYFGFNGAEDYYYRASAMRIIDRLHIPALI